MTPEGERFVGQVLRPDWWSVRSIPDGAVRAMQYPAARELLGVEVKPGDRLALRTYAAGVRASLSVTPRRARYVRQARYEMEEPLPNRGRRLSKAVARVRPCGRGVTSGRGYRRGGVVSVVVGWQIFGGSEGEL
ncbi:hypothetical protein NRB20_58260 [Nocardia sp. RB20]|uniref:Uncharacterized protein n=2 Tax=Nocardia macrotermitis TaxID=2585198 RepID=A0A7K0DCU3_9NOCA|nr:hypothetical protein [Nocardia macrotermitis]